MGAHRSSEPKREHADDAAQQSEVVVHAAPSATHAVVQWSTCSTSGRHLPLQQDDAVVQTAPSAPHAPVDPHRRTPRLDG